MKNFGLEIWSIKGVPLYKKSCFSHNLNEKTWIPLRFGFLKNPWFQVIFLEWITLSIWSKKVEWQTKTEVKSRCKHLKNVQNWVEMKWEKKNFSSWKKIFLIKKYFFKPIFYFDFPYKMWVLMNLPIIKFQKSSLQSRERIVWQNGLLLVKLHRILGFSFFKIFRHFL